MNGTRWAIATSLLLLVALAIASRQRPVLGPEGYGAVRFGSRLSQIEDKLRQRSEPPASERDIDCDYVTFPAYPGIRFMVERGVVTRGDALDAAMPNTIRIVVGTPFADLKRRFPDVVIEEHAYEPDGHYVIFRSGDGERAVVFEEVGGRIEAVRAGLEPSVEYIEGCF